MKSSLIKICLLLVIFAGCRTRMVQIFPQLPREHELSFRKKLTDEELQEIREYVIWILRNQYVLREFEKQIKDADIMRDFSEKENLSKDGPRK